MPHLIGKWGLRRTRNNRSKEGFVYYLSINGGVGIIITVCEIVATSLVLPNSLSPFITSEPV